MQCPNCGRDFDQEEFDKWNEEKAGKDTPEGGMYGRIGTAEEELGEHMHMMHGWMSDDIQKYIEYVESIEQSPLHTNRQLYI